MAIDPYTGQWVEDEPASIEEMLAQAAQGPDMSSPPPVSGPDLMAEFAGPQEQMPDDFWSRLAMGGAQFPHVPVTSKTPGGGLLALLALASGFAQGKTGQAARKIGETEQRNARAREAARTLATWRAQMVLCHS